MSTSDPGANPISAIIPGSIFQDDILPPSTTDTNDPQQQVPTPYGSPNGRTQIEVTSTIQIVLITLGVIVGALFLLGVIATYYISHKNKRAQEESKQSNTLEQGKKGSVIPPTKLSWIDRQAWMRYLRGAKQKTEEGDDKTTTANGGKANTGSTTGALNEKQEVTDDYEEGGEGAGVSGGGLFSPSERSDDEVTSLEVMASSQAGAPSSSSTHGLLDSAQRNEYNILSEDDSLGYGISRSSTPGLESALHSSNSSIQYSSLGRGGPNPRNSFMDVAQAYARRQSMIDPVLGPSLSKLPANVRMSMFVNPSRVPVVHHQQQQHLHISVPVTMDYTSGHIMTYSAPPSQPTTPGVGENAHLSNLLQDPFKTNNNSESSLNLFVEESEGEEKGNGNAEEGDNSSLPPVVPPKDTHLDPTPLQVTPRQRTMAPPTLVTYRHTMHTPWSAPLTPKSPIEEESISYQPPSRPTSPPTISERASRKNSAILLGAKSNRKSMGGIPSNDDPPGGRNFSWRFQRASVVVPEGTAPVRLWKEDAPRVDTSLTSTPLTSVTLPVSGKLEMEEEAVRDGAAVFEGRSVSRRPSRDGELTLKSGEISLTSGTLTTESEGSFPTTLQSTQQTFARTWAGGQIAVDMGGEQDGYLSKAAVVRLPSPRGCLLEDDDELTSASFLYGLYGQGGQQPSMVSVASSNTSMMSQHDYTLFLQQQQQQQQQQEILEQYQFPKEVKRNKNAGGRSYMDDFDQQQPLTQQTHKHRSVMSLGGLGDDARELGKKLTGKLRNSMFLTSTSSTSASATAATTNANATETKGAENSAQP
ncbi:hypothetical protein MVEG_09480 [Podila verticillata NRRL 6337]|nr:hypothetical protein MVEG_09480 [Podila verticillata NRRL 6337]